MHSIDIINLLIEEHPQVNIPEDFLSYVNIQEARGHQVRRSASGQLFIPFLEDLGVAYDRVCDIFEPDSTLKIEFTFPSLIEMSIDDLISFFEINFSQIFNLQEIVLDNETAKGFNRHGNEHLRTVAKRMLPLLDIIDLPMNDIMNIKKEAVIAGYLHDMGNIISRENHSLYGIYLLSQIFVDINQNEKTLSSFMRVSEAILFHEVDFGSKVSSVVNLHSSTLSLIIADKTDVSFRRVSTKSNVVGEISDIHVLINLLVTRSQLICCKEAIVWEVSFSPRASQEHSVVFFDLLKRKQRVRVPINWQKIYRKDNIEYVFIFNATFLRLYYSRLLFALRSVFAFCESVDRFELIINDDERGISLKRVFFREDYQEKMKLIEKNLFKNDLNHW